MRRFSCVLAGLRWSAASAVLIATVVLVRSATAPRAAAREVSGHRPSASCIQSAIADYADGITDDTVLVGEADAVFLGRVVANVGTSDIPTSDPESAIPVMLFSVDVLDGIKGALTGRVVVGQVAKFDERTGCLVLIEGDALLEPGEVAMLIVSRAAPPDSYLLIAGGPHGAVRANDAATRAAIVARFEVAARFQREPASARHRRANPGISAAPGCRGRTDD